MDNIKRKILVKRKNFKTSDKPKAKKIKQVEETTLKVKIVVEFNNIKIYYEEYSRLIFEFIPNSNLSYFPYQQINEKLGGKWVYVGGSNERITPKNTSISFNEKYTWPINGKIAIEIFTEEGRVLYSLSGQYSLPKDYLSQEHKLHIEKIITNSERDNIVVTLDNGQLRSIRAFLPNQLVHNKFNKKRSNIRAERSMTLFASKSDSELYFHLQKRKNGTSLRKSLSLNCLDRNLQSVACLFQKNKGADQIEIIEEKQNENKLEKNEENKIEEYREESESSGEDEEKEIEDKSDDEYISEKDDVDNDEFIVDDNDYDVENEEYSDIEEIEISDYDEDNDNIEEINEINEKDYQELIDQNEENEEELSSLVYTRYVPCIPIHCKHPAKVVESTTLASAKLPLLTYEAKLPPICYNRGNQSALSTLQLETVRYVGQRHQQFLSNGYRAGYFIGDGTGVGKGREIAGIIVDNYQRKRVKSIWFSASNSLIKDSARDLRDIGCGEGSKYYIPVIPIPKRADEKINESKGVLFVTYSMLVSKGSNSKQTRFHQIFQWISGSKTEKKNESFDGVIVFDEAHLAKNIQIGGTTEKGSKTGVLVSKLQRLLPNARIVYVSATGATEPKHMAYMGRLGLWDPSLSEGFTSFASKIEHAGIAAMEMIAMEMKSLGMYCNRFLSFEGASFDIVKIYLKENQKKMWDSAADWWKEFIREYLKGLGEGVLPASKKASKKLAISILWSSHQRFFLQLMIALKVDMAVEMAMEAIKNGKAVVIGLFSTGESALDSRLEKELDHENLLSAPLESALAMVEKWFPILEGGKKNYHYCEKQKEFISKLYDIGLPINPLDDLINRLGGVEQVAEMTGRSKRLVRKNNKKKGKEFEVEIRKPKIDNNNECANFMNKKKKIAIISEAASIGISLQASKICKNQLKRVHIILQLPWAADKAVQQLGRTHRSHQISAPEYKLLITELGGEWRLASIVAERLASLGALTYGDRRAGAGSQSISQYFISKKYASKAIDQVHHLLGKDWKDSDKEKEKEKNEKELLRKSSDVKDILMKYNNNKNNKNNNKLNIKNEKKEKEVVVIDIDNDDNDVMVIDKDKNDTEELEIISIKSENKDKKEIGYGDDDVEEIKLPNNDVALSPSDLKELSIQSNDLAIFEFDLKKEKLKRFLNRILGLAIRYQKFIFHHFIEVYDLFVLAAQQEGSFDDGIFDIKGKLAKRNTIFQHPINQSQQTFVYEINIQRGVSWEDSLLLLRDADLLRERFYNENDEADQLYSEEGNEKEIEEVREKDKYPKNGYYMHKRSFHILLALQRPSNRSTFHTIKPHLGHQPNSIDYLTLLTSYSPLSNSQSQSKWIQKYSANDSTNVIENKIRRIISGSILPTFDLLIQSLSKKNFLSTTNSKLQIVRAEIEIENNLNNNNNNNNNNDTKGEEDNEKKKYQKVVGVLIPNDKWEKVKENLEKFEFSISRKIRIRYLKQRIFDVLKINISPLKLKNQIFQPFIADYPSVLRMMNNNNNNINNNMISGEKIIFSIENNREEINQFIPTKEKIEKELLNSLLRKKQIRSLLISLFPDTPIKISQSYSIHHYEDFILNFQISINELEKILRYYSSLHDQILLGFYEYLRTPNIVITIADLKGVFFRNFQSKLNLKFEEVFEKGIKEFLLLYSNYFQIRDQNNQIIKSNNNNNNKKEKNKKRKNNEENKEQIKMVIDDYMNNYNENEEESNLDNDDQGNNNEETKIESNYKVEWISSPYQPKVEFSKKSNNPFSSLPSLPSNPLSFIQNKDNNTTNNNNNNNNITNTNNNNNNVTTNLSVIDQILSSRGTSKVNNPFTSTNLNTITKPSFPQSPFNTSAIKTPTHPLTTSNNNNNNVNNNSSVNKVQNMLAQLKNQPPKTNNPFRRS